MDVETALKPGEIPRIYARRTLLLGLGTTGACICGQILERLAWSYDKMDNVPWVRCVVLETKDVAAAPPAVRDHTRYVHLKIDKTQYATLINSPQNYEDQMGFSTWNIEAITRNGDAIVNGANNIRILGRLSLLYPPNYNAATRTIRTALSELRSLDEKDAGERYSRALKPKAVQVDLGSMLYVYVVGTLAGGTSSGCFIDMGYILQTLDGYQNAIKPTGVFLLPSSEHPNEKHTANSYAALIELNHFSSDHTRYSQQFPDRVDPRQMPPGTSPYENLYLIQAQGEQAVEYAKLVTAAADFIHSDVIGGTAAERDAKRTNIQDYFVNKDLWGATQKFFTFGLGTIEFPYPKVIKACSLRLTTVGFQQIASGEPLLSAAHQSHLSALPLLPVQALMARLLQRQGARIDESISRILQGASSRAQHANDPIDLARAQVEAAFKGGQRSDTHSDLPANIVPMTVEENGQKATVEFRAAIEQAARNFLKPGASTGLVTLTSYLEGLKKALEASLEESNAAGRTEALASLLGKADEAQEHARICRSDLPLRSAWGRSVAVKRYVAECLRYCQDYYAHRLRQACAPTCAAIYTTNLDYVKKLLDRIQNEKCGLGKEVSARITGLKILYQQTNVPYGTRFDGTVRVISGVELFDPDRTVNEEYARCLRETAEEQKLPGEAAKVEALLAGRAVQSYIESVLPALFADTNLVRRFDPEGSEGVPNLDDYQLLELARPARDAFGPLNRRSIIQRLLSTEELATDLKKANDASGLLLNWEAGLPRHRDAENKVYKYFFYNDKDPQALAFQEAVERARILGPRDNLAYINDQHLVMILHERGAFSLGTIREMQEGMDSKWRSDFNNTTIASFHSRKDVPEWTTWTRTDEEARAHSRSLFLVAVAMDVIKKINPLQYVFTYRKRRAADPGALMMSNDLDLAAQGIKAAGLQADIEERIAAERSDKRATDMINQFAQFIESSAGKFEERERSLSIEQIEAYILDYVERDAELTEKWQAKFGDTKILRLLQRDNKNNIKHDSEGRPIYICPCNRREVLGHKASDLYIPERKDGKMVPAFKCAVCKRSLEYGTSSTR